MVLERVKPPTANGSGLRRGESNGAPPKAPVALSAEVMCRLKPSEEDSGADLAGGSEERRIEALDTSTVVLDGNSLPFDKVIGPTATQVTCDSAPCFLISQRWREEKREWEWEWERERERED